MVDWLTGGEKVVEVEVEVGGGIIVILMSCNFMLYYFFSFVFVGKQIIQI